MKKLIGILIIVAVALSPIFNHSLNLCAIGCLVCSAYVTSLILSGFSSKRIESDAFIFGIVQVILALVMCYLASTEGPLTVSFYKSIIVAVGCIGGNVWIFMKYSNLRIEEIKKEGK